MSYLAATLRSACGVVGDKPVFAKAAPPKASFAAKAGGGGMGSATSGGKAPAAKAKARTAAVKAEPHKPDQGLQRKSPLTQSCVSVASSATVTTTATAAGHDAQVEDRSVRSCPSEASLEATLTPGKTNASTDLSLTIGSGSATATASEELALSPGTKLETSAEADLCEGQLGREFAPGVSSRDRLLLNDAAASVHCKCLGLGGSSDLCKTDDSMADMEEALLDSPRGRESLGWGWVHNGIMGNDAEWRMVSFELMWRRNTSDDTPCVPVPVEAVPANRRAIIRKTFVHVEAVDLTQEAKRKRRARRARSLPFRLQKATGADGAAALRPLASLSCPARCVAHSVALPR